MDFQWPEDVLAQCSGCRIENLLTDYQPGLGVCNQCREVLATAELAQTHSEYRCGDCGLYLLLLKDTPFERGEARCRCGGENVVPEVASPFAEQLRSLLSQGEPKEENLEEEDFDWCRSAPQSDISEDYNDLFDNDPGMS